MSKVAYLLPLLLLIHVNVYACRYTVREIGYSTLHQDTYLIIHLEKDLGDDRIQYLNNLFGNFSDYSNIRFTSIDPEKESTREDVRFASSQKLNFPADLLKSPDGRYLILPENKSLSQVTRQVMDSPVRDKLHTLLPGTFAVVLWVESPDLEKNKNAGKAIHKACESIENIMPYMPKQTRRGPVPVKIEMKDFEREKVFLWALGIHEVPEQPVAFVIYGRGRIMGKEIPYTHILDDTLYKLLSMIGADCECGLDRKWMLGKQIPLHWPQKISQALTDELGFDVDNPMILTEMSWILSMNDRTNLTQDEISFEPQVIDLDKEFATIPDISYPEKESKNSINNWFLIAGLIFMISVLATGLWILFRGKS